MVVLLLALMAVSGARGAVLYGIDAAGQHLYRIDTNARTSAVAANATGLNPDNSFISALDPPPAGAAGAGLFYVASVSGACVVQLTPLSASGATDGAAAPPPAPQQQWCLPSGPDNAIAALTVDPQTHNLFVLTSAALLQVTPQQFRAGNGSTVLLSSPPSNLQPPVASVWDPLHGIAWYAQGGQWESFFVGVKPGTAGGTAELVGPLSGAISQGGVVAVFWNAKAQEFAAVVSNGQGVSLDCGAVRFTVDLNSLTLTATEIFRESYTNAGCNTGAWSGADGPTEHGTLWALDNNDYWDWWFDAIDMSAPRAAVTQWELPNLNWAPYVAMQPLN